MGNQEGEKQLFNVNLAKIIGLYQILDPKTVKCCGYNVLHIVMTFLVLYTGFMTIAVCANGVYYWNYVQISSLIYMVGSSCLSNICYKMYVVIRYSVHIWDCLSVTRFDFIKHEHRDGGRLLDVWRNRSIHVTYMYFFFNIIVILILLSITAMFNHTTVELTNPNGSTNNYRINVYNLYLLASFDDTKYNRHFGVFYFIEGILAIVSIMLNFIVDIVLITLFMALMCQLQMVCTTFESHGHKTTSGRHPSANAKSEKKLTVELDVYTDLITIIMDHQAVMQKYNEFFSIFGRPMLIQISMATVNIIFCWFTVIVNFANDETAEMGSLITLQLLSLIPLFLIQLYVPCYIFGRLHDQKDCIIFSVYSSNWTEMNLKCKKLILLTMIMNNAYQKNLKFTYQNIVNMEMFSRTLRFCYTGLSMLLNYRKFKNHIN